MSGVDLDAVKARALRAGEVAVDGSTAELLNAVMESWRDLEGLVVEVMTLRRDLAERDVARAASPENSPMVAAAVEAARWGYALSTTEAAYIAGAVLDAARKESTMTDMSSEALDALEARLREAGTEDRAEIEALSDVAADAIQQLRRDMAERDAVIAAVRARLHAGSVPLGMSETAFLQRSILDALAILSRASQGAAEPSEARKHRARQEPPWPPFSEADYMLTVWKCWCGWESLTVTDKRGNPALEVARATATRHEQQYDAEEGAQ